MSHSLTFGETPSSDDKLWGVAAHLVCMVFPVVGIFGSLAIYLIHRDKPFIAYHAAQSLGLQAGIWIAGVIVSVISGVTCGLGAILYLPLAMAYFIPLYGAYIAYEGQWKGYPLIEKLGR